MVYIVAGSYAEARDYVIRKGYKRNGWRHVRHTHQVRGISHANVVFIGSWRLYKDTMDVYELIATRRCNVIVDDDF